jgi:ribosomal protein S18 acetylase RimI-like enzyme
MTDILVIPFITSYLPAIQRILKGIGWADQYVIAATQNAEIFTQDTATLGSYVVQLGDEIVGFLYVQYYAWNQLAQIQGLAVDPVYQRQRAATALVAQAETFARERNARGIYVDTPVPNERGCKFYEAVGYKIAYIMPRYYEDNLDGVTYQKFFD